MILKAVDFSAVNIDFVVDCLCTAAWSVAFTVFFLFFGYSATIFFNKIKFTQ